MAAALTDRELLARIAGYRRDAAAPTRAQRQRAAQLLRASPAAEARYVRDLRAVMKGIHAGVVAAMGLPTTEPETRTNRLDAVKVLPPQTERKLFKYVADHVGPAFDRMGKKVDKDNAEGNALLGIQPQHIPGANGVLAQAREDNIRLMQKAALTHARDVEKVLRDPANLGLRVEELAGLLRERGKVGESHAMLIARDQTLKTNAALTQARHRAVGVDEYTWSTSRDERVRPLHEALEGQRYRYDDPPVTTESGETNNPGEDIQCRCVPLPVIAELEPEEPAPPEEPPPVEEEPPEAATVPLVDPAAQLAHVIEDPHANFDAEEVMGGITHQGLSDWLRVPANQPALAIHGAIIPGEASTTEGLWGARRGIAIKTNVSAPLPQQLTATYGDTWRVADRGKPVLSPRGTITGYAKTPLEKVQDNFLHELGHHVHDGLQSRNLAAVDGVVQRAWRRVGFDDPQFRTDVYTGRKRSPAVSRYASKDRYEYFAESFNAYMTDEPGLKAHDPIGHWMVESVLKTVKILP